MKNKFIIHYIVLIIIGLVVFSCEGEPSLTADQLFTNNFNYQKITNIYKSRSGDKENVSPKEVAISKVLSLNSTRGVSAYNAQEYKKAIEYFSTYLAAANKKNSEIKFYLSISYLADNQLSKAQEGFKELMKKSSKIRKMEAEWYLVLTLIKSNSILDAERGLKKIIQKRKHQYREKALLLQKQIKKYLLK